MKGYLMRLTDKLSAFNRSIIDHIKNMIQIDHSGYRSSVNFIVIFLCMLIACFHQANKFLLYLKLALPQSA
jgi:hypothetical protein